MVTPSVLSHKGQEHTGVSFCEIIVEQASHHRVDVVGVRLPCTVVNRVLIHDFITSMAGLNMIFHECQERVSTHHLEAESQKLPESKGPPQVDPVFYLQDIQGASHIAPGQGQQCILAFLCDVDTIISNGWNELVRGIFRHQ